MSDVDVARRVLSGPMNKGAKRTAVTLGVLAVAIYIGFFLLVANA